MSLSWPRIATVIVIVGFWLVVIYVLGSGCFHPVPAHPAVAR